MPGALAILIAAPQGPASQAVYAAHPFNFRRGCMPQALPYFFAAAANTAAAGTAAAAYAATVAFVVTSAIVAAGRTDAARSRAFQPTAQPARRPAPRAGA